MTSLSTRAALVIGATGGVGGEVARTLVAQGWRVLGLNRRPELAPAIAGVTWLRGDAMNAGEVAAAARGVQLIVHAANPPGYRNWSGLALPMLESTIEAAVAERALILFPGTIYNFDPGIGAHLAEDAPQTPQTRKGAIRVEMERRLHAATAGGARVLIVRAGDFFGPRVGSSWMSQGVLPRTGPLRAVSYPGPKDVRHAWAYLPDLAQAMVGLVERARGLPPFARFHFAGHAVTGAELMDALDAAAGRRLARKSLPWLAVQAASPFNETLREMLEVRYLWRTPLTFDNAALVRALGAEPHTPLVEALGATLEGLNLLEAPQPLRSAA